MKIGDISWDVFTKRQHELHQELMSSTFDAQKRGALQKELAFLGQVLSAKADIERFEDQKKELESLANGSDHELAMLAHEELAVVTAQQSVQEAALEALLFPPDQRDKKSVFLEIRAGAGGQEAALFAADLMRMYTMYAQKKNWRASVVSESYTDLKGYREVVLHIEGKGVYGHLKFESGVHRVQRVPQTETSGRVHTSTATVVVLPETGEVESVTINPADLKIDTYRAGGAGGQHVNKTDSAVRITHIPTGLVVACQDDRSQHKNKAKAMKILQARLVAAQKETQEAELSAQRREQVGTGMRSEKVRTYNYPQNRITDHQVEVTLNKLDMVMEGDLDDIIEPLREHERLTRRKNLAPSY